MSTDARLIERFQLGFLLVLGAHVPYGWVVKGGVNLRAFYGSPRASKDIDFDAYGPPGAFEARVNAVLGGRALQRELMRAQIELVAPHPSKRTARTLRWKPELRYQQRTITASTKLEFSFRMVGEDQACLDWLLDHQRVDDIDSALRNRHSMALSPSCPHYDVAAAYKQKMDALALRSATKTRDVFDMNWLLARDRAACLQAPSAHALRAAECASELTYEQYSLEVAPFLDEEDRELYGSQSAWRQAQEEVMNDLLLRTKVIAVPPKDSMSEGLG